MSKILPTETRSFRELELIEWCHGLSEVPFCVGIQPAFIKEDGEKEVESSTNF
jgi:hypothetical protein